MSRLIRILLVTVLTAAGLTLFATSATAAGPMTGVVRTGDGTPLGGATVAILDETGKGVAEETTTASDGSYTLPDCPDCVGEMFARADGYTTQRGGLDFTLYQAPKPFVGSSSTSILTFAWNAVPGAVAYRITFAAEHTFSHPTIIVRATKTVHAFKQLLANHIYYLRVYPIDAAEHVIRPDIWLGDDHRSVAGRTGYVNNLHVVDRTSTSLKFQWAPFGFASTACCTAYEVQLASSPTFAAVRTRTSAHGDDVLTFTNLAPGTLYYARVRARNVSNTYTTPWSGTRTTSTL